MAIYGVLLFIGGILFLDFDVRVRSSLYVFLFFLPICLIFYIEVSKQDLRLTYKNLLISYLIIGYLMFFLFKFELIASNRYQHIGNILAGLLILIIGYKLNSKKLKYFLVLLTLYFLLIVGSRQAILGLLFCLLVYIFLSNYKILIYFCIISLLIYLNWDYLFALLEQSSIGTDYQTTRRLIYAIKADGGSSFDIRMDIYNSLIDKVGFFPNLSFSPNQDHLLPHNFFLEYSLICGYFIGFIFIVFLLINVFNVARKNRNNPLLYFTLLYFLTFNVSSGLTAAKYFIYYCFLLFIINKKKVRL